MVTAAQVKELRDRTGAGMMDSKKALVENDGNLEQALDWLRQKGIAKAAKKSSRVAAEGSVLAKAENGKAAVVEVNSETDFAAKNDKFKEFSNAMLTLVMESGETDVEKLKAMACPGSSMTVAEKQTELVATIGENISLRRAAFVEGDTVGAYVHMGGKIGVVTSMSGATGKDDIAKQVSMHVAASNPQFLNRDQIDQDVLAREKAIYEEQARASGKPEQVMEKMVSGRLSKFAEEICLVDQAFVMNPDQKVGQVVKDASLEIASFTRFGLGEGIEKAEEDFAAEVAATMNA